MKKIHPDADYSFFYENEVNANKNSGILLIIYSSILVLVFILSKVGVWYTSDDLVFSSILISVAVFHLLTTLVCLKRKGRDRWFKYLFMICFFIAALLIGLYSSAIAYITLMVPVVYSCWYFNPNFTGVVSIMAGISMCGSSLMKCYVRPILCHDMDVRFIQVPEGTTITFNDGFLYKSIMEYGYDQTIYLRTEVAMELLPVMLSLLFVSVMCIVLSTQGKHMILRHRKDAENKLALERDLYESRTQTMMSQIQPHFVFNVLNTIYELCDEDAKSAQHAIDSFSTYLRTNMDSLNTNGMVPFSAEIEHIKTYVYLEKLRFGDRIRVVYDISTDNFYVPPLSLQPLVENAVKHGICKKKDGGEIRISTSDKGAYTEIVISDDGKGFDPEQNHNDGKKHLGLKNSKARLEQMAGASVEISSVPDKGTEILIRIPKGDR